MLVKQPIQSINYLKKRDLNWFIVARGTHMPLAPSWPEIKVYKARGDTAPHIHSSPTREYTSSLTMKVMVSFRYREYFKTSSSTQNISRASPLLKNILNCPPLLKIFQDKHPLLKYLLPRAYSLSPSPSAWSP